MKSLKIPAVAVALSLLMLLTSCGTRYYSATVAGYVKDAAVGTAGDATGNGATNGNGGINDAEIRLYLKDPATSADAADAYVVKSSTASSSGNNGYWSHKVIWETSTPAFSDIGDSGTIWVTVKRMGYFPKTVKVTGILSDSTNVVPTIELTLIKTLQIKTKVVLDSETGRAVNGVNVVLDLESTAANEADFTATTGSFEGEDGIAVFNDVPWNDADSIPEVSRAILADGTATGKVRVYVNDPNYYADLAHKGLLATLPLIEISSGTKKDWTSTPLVVRSTQFSMPELRGRVFDVQAPTTGLNGVQVSIRIPASNAANDPSVTTATVGNDGWFVFNNLAWNNIRPTRSAVGKYDDVTPAQIYISGGNFYSDNDADKPINISLTSDVKLDLSTLDPPLLAGKATFKKGSIKGKIVLPNMDGTASGTGVNGVTVALNLADSNNNPADTAVTANVGGIDGIYEFKNVTWVNTKPNWADTAQTKSTESIQVYVNDNNYTSPNVAASPFVETMESDVSGAAEVHDMTDTPLRVRRTTFNVPKITGRVSNGTSAIGNIRVSLTLKSVTANGNNQASVTTDSSGNFTFTNVGWTNQNPTAPQTPSDTVTASLQINDGNYTATAREIAIVSGAETTWASSADDLVVTRTAGWSFSTTIQGTVRHKNGATSGTVFDPVGGQQIRITPIAPDAAVAITGPLTLSTDANGQFTTNITWTRAASYVPPTAAQQSGGDTLIVKVEFPYIAPDRILTTATPAGTGTVDTAIRFAAVNSFQVNSWQNTNDVPTATDTDPAHY